MPRPERYRRQLEAIRNILDKLFEKAGAAVLKAQDGLPEHLDLLDGQVRIYHDGQRWRGEMIGFGIKDAGLQWTDAAAFACKAVIDWRLDSMLLEEDLDIMFEGVQSEGENHEPSV